MTVINYIGSNGVGKSTRCFYLVEYLKKKYDYKVIKYEVSRKGKPIKIENIGFLFSNGWMIMGRYSKNNNQWLSLDTGAISKWEQRFKFIKDMKSRKDIDVLFLEGYFNNRSKAGSPKNIKEQTGVDEVHVFVSHYDNIKDFIKRTNTRTGKSRGLDWAENSAGWKDNNSFIRMLKIYNEEKDPNDLVQRVDINAPKDYLVQIYFNELFSTEELQKILKEKEQEKKTLF